MPRGIWKGTLGFGLVTIGVELLTAEKPEVLDLDLLDRRDHARIGYQKINKTTGEVVPQSEITRGKKVSEGHYVVLSEADLKAANPKSTQSVDIVAFVSADEIPLMFYAKPYYVSPLKGSDKAYALLRDALAASKRVGLAQIVVHTRQYLAAVYPYEGALVVQLLRYAHELKSPEDAGVKHIPQARRTGTARAQSAEFAMATQLIDSMDQSWKPAQYKDTYKEDLLKLVKKRARSGKQAITPAIPETSGAEPRTLDLVAALKRSLKSGGSSRAIKRPLKRASAGTKATHRKSA